MNSCGKRKLLNILEKIIVVEYSVIDVFNNYMEKNGVHRGYRIIDSPVNTYFCSKQRVIRPCIEKKFL